MKFKIFGTKIYISFLFAAIVAFMLVIDRTGLVIPTLLAALVHEIGHLFTMRIAECQPKAIRLIPASIQIVRGFSKKKNGEIAIALAGPALNLVFFAVFLFVYSNTNSYSSLRFSILNLILAVYNLLPVNGLDGGIILKFLLMKKFDEQKAVSIVRVTAFLLGLAALTVGITLTYRGTFNISAYIVALYLIVTSVIKT